MMPALTENQMRLSQGLESRSELFFFSDKDDRLYYVSEIEELDFDRLTSLLLECEVEVGHLFAVLEENDKRLAAGFDLPQSGALRKKAIFVKRFYKKLKAEVDARKVERNKQLREAASLKSIEDRVQKQLLNEQSRHQVMNKRHCKETNRILFEMIEQELGEGRLSELRERARFLANQIEPDPTLPENRHLWETEAPPDG